MKSFKKISLFLLSLFLILVSFGHFSKENVRVSAMDKNSMQETIINDNDIGDGINQFRYFGHGDWGQDRDIESLYNGTSHWTDLDEVKDNSIYYEISFDGTGIEIYGNKEEIMGISSVSIDDKKIGEIDAYNNKKIYNQKLFEIHDLEDEEHVLRVTLTNQKNEKSEGYNTLVDYAKVFKPINNTPDETSNVYTLEINKTFEIPLTQLVEEAEWSSDDPQVASVENGIVTANTTGETVISVSNDSVEYKWDIKVISLLLEEEVSSGFVYSEEKINDSVTGTGDQQFNYHGSWGIDQEYDYLYKGDSHWSDISNWGNNPRDNYYTFKFTGNKISVYGSLQTGLGIYDVYIDDIFYGTIDAYAPEAKNKQLYFESPILEDKEHTLKVVMTGDKNKNSSAASGFVDFVEITKRTEVVYPEEISIDNHSTKYEEFVSITPKVNFHPENTNMKKLSFEVDESMIQKNDDGSLMPIKSGTTEIVAVTKGENDKTIKSKPFQITIIVGHKLMKADFSSTNSVYLPEDYDKLAEVQEKQDKITTWKNDQGNSSIVLLTKEEDVSATLSSSDFIDKSGNILSSINVEPNFQKYVSTYTGSNWIPTNPRPFDPPPVPEGHRQDFPDIIYGPEMKIDKDSVQPIWVKINVPEDTEAGIYEGTINIEIDNGTTIHLDQTIEVLDIVLEETKDTDEDDYYLNLWQYPYSSADYYDVEVFSEEHLNIVKNQMKPYQEAGGRVGTASIVEEPWYHQTYADYPSMVKWEMVNDKLEFDYTDFDIWADFLLNDAEVSYIETYSIVPWENRVVYMENGIEKAVKPKPGTQEWDDLWRPFMKSFVDHLEKKGWFDEIIIAMDERPTYEMNAALDLIESVSNKEGETLKVGGAFNTYDESTWDRLFNVTPHMGQLTSGGIDKEDFKNIAEKRRKEGKKTTIYTMIGDYPGMFTMSDPSESAWTIWFTESFNTDGFLRWAYDAWVEEPLEDTSHPYFESGDMFQVYPGDYAGKETQVRTSPRFERLSESINDVRKLRQISRVNESYDTKADEIVNSVKKFYGQASSNGIGTAGFRVPNESTRVAIADEVNRLENEVISLSKEYISEKVTADPEAAEKVKRAIYNLPRASELTLADKAKVEKVREMVNNLSDKDKEFVTSISQLETREAKLDQLESDRQVKEVKRAIYNLPRASGLTLAEKAKVEEVREMVNNLADEDKKLVTTISQLEAREAKLDKLEK